MAFGHSRFVEQWAWMCDNLLMCRLKVLLVGGCLVNVGSCRADRYLVSWEDSYVVRWKRAGRTHGHAYRGMALQQDLHSSDDDDEQCDLFVCLSVTLSLCLCLCLWLSLCVSVRDLRIGRLRSTFLITFENTGESLVHRYRMCTTLATPGNTGNQIGRSVINN